MNSSGISRDETELVHPQTILILHSIILRYLIFVRYFARTKTLFYETILPNSDARG